MFVQQSFLTRFYKSVQQRRQTSHGTDAFCWRSHNLHADKSVEGCTLITVQRWNTGAPPTPPTPPPLHRQAGCGCWSAASAVSTGGRHKQRERRRSDYASEAQRMTWPELRAARQLAGAPTLIRKISNWWEANVRTTRSPPPCRSPSRHSCSYCFSVGFHRLTWLGCGSNLARPPWQPASERLFNQSCNAPGFKSHQLPSSGDKSKKQQLLAALIWVPSSRKNEQNGAEGVSPWTKFFSLPASGWNHFSYMLKIPFPNAFCGLFCCMDVWDKCRSGIIHFVSILSMIILMDEISWN